MAYTPSAQLRALMNQYARMRDYKPLTAAQMKKQANQRYQSLYDQQRLSAQQSFDATNSALARQLAGLGTSYDVQREASQKNYDNAYSQANRQSVSRGMQRSSFNNSTLSNITEEGNEAQQEINAAQTKAEGDIGEQQTLLSTQLANQLAQFDSGQQADILSYVDQLTEQEYQKDIANEQARQQLAAQIYQFQHAERQAAEERARWEREMAEQQRQFDASRSGRSGGGGSSGQQQQQQQQPPASGGSLFDIIGQMLQNLRRPSNGFLGIGGGR